MILLPTKKKDKEYLLKTKKLDPYYICYSAITSDSDFLPEYAPKKKNQRRNRTIQPSKWENMKK